MTPTFFDEPRSDPASREVEEPHLRPRLTARKENPPPIGQIRMSEQMGARATARHFAGRRGSPTVRPREPADPHRRKVAVTAQKVLTPHGARRILLRHVAYIQRGVMDSADRDSVFFDKAEDRTEPRRFVERCQNDSAHFRLVVNPEDGTELGDLKTYARRLLASVEEDLGGDLDWIAGAHFDTGRPHLHIMVRGRRANGQSIRVSGAYLSSGLRERARDTATEILGPRAERVADRTIQADRLTPLDGMILQAAPHGQLDEKRIPEAFRTDALRRLVFLETRGRVVSTAPGHWRLSADLRETLLRAGQAHARELAAARILEHSEWRDQRSRLAALSLQPGDKLVGGYVGVHRTGRYPTGAQAVVLDLTDGRLAHFLMRDARSVLCLDRIRKGAVIEISGAPRGDRIADQVIAEVAASRGGVWSAADHAAARPDDWPKFVAFHEKRVEAMSVAGACTALGDGRFAVPADYLSLARQADVAQWGEAEQRVRVLDDRTLDEQVSAIGLTWLDRLMTTDSPPDFSGPFGDAVRRAMPERAKRLRITGLGSGEPLVLSEADVHRLTTFEIKSVFEDLRGEGKAVFLIASGDRAAGVYTGRAHIAGVPFAVLEDTSAVSLVPWTPGMEACRGRTLSAVVQDGATSFRTVRSLGRGLGLG